MKSFDSIEKGIFFDTLLFGATKPPQFYELRMKRYDGIEKNIL
jgi:hypothetical protein